MKYWFRRAFVLTLLLSILTLARSLFFTAEPADQLPRFAPVVQTTAPTPTSYESNHSGNPHIYDRSCLFPRTARRLRSGEAIRVVAIGSSSTEGAGASSPATTYPALLQSYLLDNFPGHDIAVYNKGISGETAEQNLARFDRDIIAFNADLVIWQVGTNDALRKIPFADVEQVIRSGVAQLRSHGIDVALLDVQYLGGGDDTDLAKFQAHLRELSDQLAVARIPRWSLMKGFVQSGQYSLTDFIISDGLHTTDLAYQITADYTARLVLECVSQNR